MNDTITSITMHITEQHIVTIPISLDHCSTNNCGVFVNDPNGFLRMQIAGSLDALVMFAASLTAAISELSDSIKEPVNV